MRRALRIAVPLLIVALGVLVARLIVSSAGGLDVAPEPPPPPLVETITVHREDVRTDVESQGTVVPATVSVLSAQVSGRVEWVSESFERGGFFEQDELLLRIDPRDYELALVRAEAEVARADLRVATEESEARVALREWEMIGEGEPDPLVRREPQLAEARALARAARAELERARIDLERTAIRAPYAGRVLARGVDVGQYVATATRLGEIYALDRAEVRLPLRDAELSFLDQPLGLPGAVPVTSLPTVTLATRFAGRHWTWEGRIVRVEAEIDDRTRMLHLVAEVADPYVGVESGRPPLKSGLFVDAVIHGGWARGVIAVPRSALRGADRVLVVDEEERLRFRTVEVLRSERDRVLVTDGLREGERVCVSLLEITTEGMRVRAIGRDGEPARDRP